MNYQTGSFHHSFSLQKQQNAANLSEGGDAELAWRHPSSREKGLSIILPDLLFISLCTVSVQTEVPLGCPNYPAMPWNAFESMEIHPFVVIRGGWGNDNINNSVVL